MKKKFKVSILTIFPEMFPGPLAFSLAGKALEDGLWELNTYDIRDFAKDKYKTVDDKPFGGGHGLILKPDVMGDAISHIKQLHQLDRIIYMSPRGKLMSHEYVENIASECNSILIICGRFEGLDERVIEEFNIEELSIGDYILSGGEIAALAFIDSTLRHIPSLLKEPGTLEEESFTLKDEHGHKLLEYPQYTKPQTWKDRNVPEVLISGDHKKIKKWRMEKALELTKKRRPEFLEPKE